MPSFRTGDNIIFMGELFTITRVMPRDVVIENSWHTLTVGKLSIIHA